ncbi:MAG: glycosyl hydrolase, partial [Verrucomicrobia bacterium]|nr:glycosyl hydrolase [Verrucomicrobiota bacterium]
SAAAIAAQGLLRMGHYLEKKGGTLSGERYFHAGLTILDTLFDEPYLSTSDRHQGLILHSIYHQPNGWDKIPAGAKVPLGESSMWGDYHAREAAVYVQRLIDKKLPYYTFFGPA